MRVVPGFLVSVFVLVSFSSICPPPRFILFCISLPPSSLTCAPIHSLHRSLSLFIPLLFSSPPFVSSLVLHATPILVYLSTHARIHTHIPSSLFYDFIRLHHHLLYPHSLSFPFVSSRSLLPSSFFFLRSSRTTFLTRPMVLAVSLSSILYT